MKYAFKVKHLFWIGLLGSLLGCGGGGASDAPFDTTTPMDVDMMDPNHWEIGPIIGGVNYSVGIENSLQKHPEGWSLDIPYPTAQQGHVHYVTVPISSLKGKTKIILKARLEMAPEVKLVPVKFPQSPSLLTVYFQRQGDNWSAQGTYETYRWYASFGTRSNLSAGQYVLEAPLDANWTAVLSSSKNSNPQAFDQALQYAGRVGFVLGGGDGLGHGVYATGPARLVITSFTVQ